MSEKLRVLRDHEGSVLETSVKEGDTVYEYWGATYGCITNGVAVCKIEGEAPFFELPWNTVEYLNLGGEQ